MKLHTVINSLAVALAISGLAACSSGGDSTGTAGTNGTVVGAIAGFGSIIMNNGIEYDTSGLTDCEVDDSSVAGVCEDSLGVGMKISMHVDASGLVTSLRYDDDLEGPVTDVTGTGGNYSFRIFGVEVVTQAPGTQWQDFNADPPLPADLDGVIVEVSGEWQNNKLFASYVEKQNSSDTTYEVKGMVDTVTGTTFTMALRSGAIMTVDADNANLVPRAGDYIEVEGSYDGVIFTAIRIEIEDEDDFDDDGEAEITGTLLEDTSSSTGYSIGSTTVDISSASSCTGLTGSVVEAEGSYDQATGILVVRECENEDDELEMKCQVNSVTVDTELSKVGTIECAFPNTTGGPLPVEFRDSPNMAVFADDDSINHFDLTDIRSGDCVEIEASKDSSGALVAGFVELEDIGSGCDAYELKGQVDNLDANTITVLGITYNTNGSTSYPEGAPVVGNIAEIVDSNGDGTADIVENENTSSGNSGDSSDD